MIKRQARKSVIWGSLIGGLCIIGMLYLTGPENFFDQIKNVNPLHFFIYFFFSMIVYLIRALRFRLLVAQRGTLAELYSVVCIHNFLLNILPFSGGDLSFPLLLKKYKISESYLEGVPSLVIARLQDLIVTALFLMISLLWIGSLGTFFNPMYLTAGMAIGFLSLGGFFWIGRKKIMKMDLSRFQGVPLIGKIMDIVIRALSSAKEINRSIIIQSSILAILAKFTGVIGAYYLINGIGLSMSFPIAFMFCSLYVFLPFLPINTIAGLGVTEVFIGGFFLFVGVQKELIVPASIQLHALQLSVAVFLGILGITQIHFLRKLTL